MIDDRLRIPGPIARQRVPDASEIDVGRLRDGRLARLQQMMRHHDLAVCLFFNAANIRYATGTGAMSAWAESAFARYCIVPAEGAPVLFEGESAIHVSTRVVADVRQAHYWYMEGTPSQEYVRRWAAEIRSVLCELGLEGEPLAVDKLDTPGFLALQTEQIRLVDSSPATVDAREVKTPEEVQLMRINGGIGDAMLAEFEAAVRPGVRECELLAVLAESLIRRRGEYIFTGLVAAGANTNPWGSEAGDKVVMPGELVGVDTDAVGYEGYVIDVSRTFLCDGRATHQQKEAYRVAHHQVTAMAELVRPGMTFDEFAQAAPPLPEEYRAQRYYARAHQAGLEDEGPSIPFIEDLDERNALPADRTIQPNMILCVECYAGEVGAPSGVKLEDQLLVTEHGAEPPCIYPYEERLLS
jgi:Xaa-Pro aminopeptidase